MTPLQFAQRLRTDLRARRWLRWHCSLIGALTLLAAWVCSYALMLMGADALSMRYGIAFAVSYGVFLCLLYVWAHWLLSRDEGDWLQVDGGGSGPRAGKSHSDAPPLKSGEGGDFSGAGSGGSFDVAEPASGLAEGAGQAAGSVLEAAGAADEGALVLIPLALLVGVALAIGAVLGFVVFGLFGVEVLLAVAVEIAFASVGGALAYKAGSEGWIGAALRRTWSAAVVALVGVVLLGAAIDHWLPEARSLPHAIRLLRAV